MFVTLIDVGRPREVAQMEKESRFRNLVNFCLCNLEYWALESGIRLKDSGMPLKIGIQKYSGFIDKDWNPVSGIQSPWCGIPYP